MLWAFGYMNWRGAGVVTRVNIVKARWAGAQQSRSRRRGDGMERKEEPVLDAVSQIIAAVLGSMKTHKWWWAGGAGATVVAVVAAVLVFGGFFGPSGKLICTATLDSARNFGVVPYSASLANTDAKKTDVKDRRVCQALADGDTYNLTVDLTCKDSKGLKKGTCTKLYSVERADGLSTYQIRQVPPDEENEAAVVPPANPATAQDGAAQSPIDNSDVQPVTGAAAGNGAAQPANSGDANAQQPNPQQ
jgi:hypothetical protein